MDAEQPDWDLIDAVLRDAARDVRAFAAGVTGEIRRELPQYAVVAEAELITTVAGLYRVLFAGLAARRPPTADEMDHARAVGRLRAEQGIPVETVLAAYQIGYRRAWDELSARARDRGDR